HRLPGRRRRIEPPLAATPPRPFPPRGLAQSHPQRKLAQRLRQLHPPQDRRSLPDGRPDPGRDQESGGGAAGEGEVERRMKVNAPRFELDECRNEAECEFVESLHSRAEARGWYADAWPRDDRIIVTIDLMDQEYNYILRMLRVDFDGSEMLAGPDETYQLV